ncbi:MAG: hypothetical protein PWP47_1227, partial [Synergistaceae bacterium]|nr:hypothetical protein [Synergistaceae bacterium]
MTWDGILRGPSFFRARLLGEEKFRVPLRV